MDNDPKFALRDIEKVSLHSCFLHDFLAALRTVCRARFTLLIILLFWKGFDEQDFSCYLRLLFWVGFGDPAQRLPCHLHPCQGDLPGTKQAKMNLKQSGQHYIGNQVQNQVMTFLLSWVSLREALWSGTRQRRWKGQARRWISTLWLKTPAIQVKADKHKVNELLLHSGKISLCP